MSYPFSRASQYAISALVFLAGQGGAISRQYDIAVAIEAPLPYLSKLLATLSRAQLVQARRGPNGGVRLALSPDEIHLGDIIAVIEGAPAAQGCILGKGHCDELRPCTLHKTWLDIRALIAHDLEHRTLAELIASPPAAAAASLAVISVLTGGL